MTYALISSLERLILQHLSWQKAQHMNRVDKAVFILQTIFFTNHNVDEHSVKNENLSYWSNII